MSVKEDVENRIICLTRRLRGHNLTFPEGVALLKAIKELEDTVKVATREKDE